MPVNRINNVVIKPVNSVKPSRSMRTVPDFTDYMYKIEQNIKNEMIADSNKSDRNIVSKSCNNNDIISKASSDKEGIGSEKSFEPLTLSCNLNKSVRILKDKSNTTTEKMYYNDSYKISSSELTQSVSYIKETKQLSLQEAEENLKECSKSIIDFASPAVLLNASYLLSVTAVISLLNPKLDND